MLFVYVAVTSLVLVSHANAWNISCSSLHSIQTTPFSQFIGDWVLSDLYLNIENWPGLDSCFKLEIYNATDSGMNMVTTYQHGNKAKQTFNQTIRASGDKLGEWTNTFGHRASDTVQQRLLAAEPEHYFVIADCDHSGHVVSMRLMRRVEVQLSTSEKQKVEQLVNNITASAGTRSFHHTQDTSC